MYRYKNLICFIFSSHSSLAVAASISSYRRIGCELNQMQWWIQECAKGGGSFQARNGNAEGVEGLDTPNWKILFFFSLKCYT